MESLMESRLVVEHSDYSVFNLEQGKSWLYEIRPTAPNLPVFKLSFSDNAMEQGQKEGLFKDGELKAMADNLVNEARAYLDLHPETQFVKP